jgi:hypothetical protein
LSELFEREPIIAEARGLNETFGDIYRATDRAEGERRLDAFLGAEDLTNQARARGGLCAKRRSESGLEAGVEGAEHRHRGPCRHQRRRGRRRR